MALLQRRASLSLVSKTHQFWLALSCLLWSVAGAKAEPGKPEYLSLAKQGWVYEYRSSILRRNPDLPPIRINSRDIATETLCLIGAPPNPDTERILTAFQTLLRELYGRKLPFQMARSIRDCAPLTRTYLRLYSGATPDLPYNADLRHLDDLFTIGLPRDRAQRILSPAQATTFFGRRGATAYLLIKQSAAQTPTPLETAFFTSILVEELYQVFSFGIDIFKFDREAPFMSKLQEHTENLRFLAWESEAFMKRLLESNPPGLCVFDVFMLHALAETELDHINSTALLEFLDQDFDRLLDAAVRTMDDPRFQRILDQDCASIAP